MKKLKVIIILSILPILIIGLMYGIIIPDIIKRDIPKMEGYLKDEGFTEIEYVGLNSFKYETTFKTNKGIKHIRYSSNGLFQLVY